MIKIYTVEGEEILSLKFTASGIDNNMIDRTFFNG